MNLPLRLARVALGLSQRRLAGKCGMTQADISRIELGWRPTPEQQRALAKALKVPVGQLFPSVEVTR